MTPSVCRVCKFQVQAVFTSVLLKKYYTQYYQCNNCGYVQTGDPFWLEEAYKILNLDPKKNPTKEDVKKAHAKIQKKIHPDISPETTRLSAIVNEAKDLILKNKS